MGGEKLWHWLRGEDFGDPELEHQKSIGHSHVLSPELRTPEGAYAVANKLLHKAAMRLRKARLWAANMTLTLRFSVGAAFGASPATLGAKLPAARVPGQPNPGGGAAAAMESKPLRPKGRKSHSSSASPSGTWFPTICTRSVSFRALKKRENGRGSPLTMDRVNYKYGTNTLCFAGMLLAGAAAPTRIAFSSIPDLF